MYFNNPYIYSRVIPERHLFHVLATKYIVRRSYDRQQLAQNFDNAEAIDKIYGIKLNSPKESGQIEEMNILLNDEDLSKPLYIAIKAVDDVGKMSDISNIVTVLPNSTSAVVAPTTSATEATQQVVEAKSSELANALIPTLSVVAIACVAIPGLVYVILKAKGKRIKESLEKKLEKSKRKAKHHSSYDYPYFSPTAIGYGDYAMPGAAVYAIPNPMYGNYRNDYWTRPRSAVNHYQTLYPLHTQRQLALPYAHPWYENPYQHY